MKHFGIPILVGKHGAKLNREYYAIPNKYKLDPKIQTDEWCEQHRQDCLYNFDLNMKFFSSLNHDEMEDELQQLLNEYPECVEVFNLYQYQNTKGCYIMVLDEYCQVYIGATEESIHKRIIDHWLLNRSFDHLIFGDKTTSKLSIDSFKALDTTRIFAYQTNEPFLMEKVFIKYFSNRFLCNRLSGGLRQNETMEPDDFITMHRKLL